MNNWKVTKKGDLLNTKMNYLIEKERFLEKDWIAHLKGKIDIDFQEFVNLYFEELVKMGEHEMKITIY